MAADRLPDPAEPICPGPHGNGCDCKHNGTDPHCPWVPVSAAVSPADTPDLAEKLRSLARAGMPHTHGLVNSFDPECSPDRWCARCDFDTALAALLAVGERDRQQIARLTAAYCDPKMWRETWLDNGASVWEFLCAADCDEPWNPIAVLAGEEDAGDE